MPRLGSACRGARLCASDRIAKSVRTVTTETGKRMAFQPHPSCQPPENVDMKLWRYMDFTKYVSLIKERALYFSSPRLLGDSFEGSYTQPNVANDLELAKAVYPDLTINSEEEMQNWIKNRESMRYHAYHGMRNIIYVNCWHMNDYESAAMWSLYVSSGQGIAVQTTYRRLGESLVDTDSPTNVVMYGGVVKYIDYDRDFISEENAFNALLCKRKSFEHEREFRAVGIYFPPNPEGTVMSFEGIPLTADLDTLIERVYVSPGSPDWIKELVESVTDKYGLTGKEVVTSSLDQRPMY